MRIGFDLLEISRIIRPISNPRFRERVYTPRELEYLDGKPPESWAGVFAAKEAVSKALGIGLLAMNPGSIEILREPGGAPYALYGGRRLEISVTHTKTTAGAVCICSNIA